MRQSFARPAIRLLGTLVLAATTAVASTMPASAGVTEGVTAAAGSVRSDGEPNVQCPALTNPASRGGVTMPFLPRVGPCGWIRAADGSYRVFGSLSATPGELGPTSWVQWIGAKQGGVSQAKASQQWFRLPTAVAAALSPTSASRYISDLDAFPGPGTATYVVMSTGNIYLISPAGSADPYGQMAPITVRSVASGAIPASVTVQLSQVRQANGDIDPIRLSQTSYLRAGGYSTYSDAIGTGQLDLRLSDITVDGIQVDVDKRCGPGRPTSLELTGKGFDQSQPQPDDSYVVVTGGLLSGNVTIPAFTGCRTPSGDDISPLLTALISGDENPVKITQGMITPRCFPILVASFCDRYYPGDPPLPTKD